MRPARRPRGAQCWPTAEASRCTRRSRPCSRRRCRPRSVFPAISCALLLQAGPACRLSARHKCGREAGGAVHCAVAGDCRGDLTRRGMPRARRSCTAGILLVTRRWLAPAGAGFPPPATLLPGPGCVQVTTSVRASAAAAELPHGQPLAVPGSPQGGTGRGAHQDTYLPVDAEVLMGSYTGSPWGGLMPWGGRRVCGVEDVETCRMRRIVSCETP